MQAQAAGLVFGLIGEEDCAAPSHPRETRHGPGKLSEATAEYKSPPQMPVPDNVKDTSRAVSKGLAAERPDRTDGVVLHRPPVAGKSASFRRLSGYFEKTTVR